jgi:hypothetical protein
MPHNIPLFKTGWGIAKKYLPNWLIRFFLKKDKIAKQLLVGLNPGYGIELQNSSIPTLSIQVVLTNHSPILITVDRIHVQFWLGQPVVTEDYTRRIALEAYSTKVEFLSFQLADNQLQKIKDSLDNERRIRPGNSASVRLDLDCETGLGWIAKTENLNYNGEILR